MSISDMYGKSQVDNMNAPAALDAIQSFITYYKATPSIQNGDAQELYNMFNNKNLYQSSQTFAGLAKEYTSGSNPIGAIDVFKLQWLPEKFDTPQPLQPVAKLITSWFSDTPNIPTYSPKYNAGTEGSLNNLITNLDSLQTAKNGDERAQALGNVAKDIIALNATLKNHSSLDGYMQDLYSMLNDDGGGGSLVSLASQSNLAALGSRLTDMMRNNFSFYNNLADIQTNEFNVPGPMRRITPSSPATTKPIDLKSDDKKKP